MLKFARNKLVGVAREGADTLCVYGVLEDDMYAVELTVTVTIPDRRIAAVAGRWKRWTTPECPRSLEFLKEAEGLPIDETIQPKIHKIIGRKACRHFANLMIECAHAAGEAIRIVQWEEVRACRPDLTLKAFVEAGAGTPPAGGSERTQKGGPAGESPVSAAPGTHAPGPAAKSDTEDNRFQPQARDGFVIDLHVHTYPASPCSSASIDAMIGEARRIGLDGLCVTDHNFVWSDEEIRRIGEKHGFPVFRGNEITTDQGDVLVFGFHENVRGIIKLEELREKVRSAGGFLIVAHPFRGFLTFGAGELGLTAERAKDRPLFQWIDAVEVLNGKVTERENNLALEVAGALKMPVTGGSDAHETSELGRYATTFSTPVRTEADLVDALRSGSYKPVAFRKERGLV